MPHRIRQQAAEAAALVREASPALLAWALALIASPAVPVPYLRLVLLAAVVPVGARLIRQGLRYTPLLIARDVTLLLTVASLLRSPARYVSLMATCLAVLTLAAAQDRLVRRHARERVA